MNNQKILQVQLATIFQFLNVEFNGVLDTNEQETKLLGFVENIALSQLFENIGLNPPSGLPELTLDTLGLSITSDSNFSLFGKASFGRLTNFLKLGAVSFPLKSIAFNYSYTPTSIICSIKVEGFDDEYLLDIPGLASLKVSVLELNFQSTTNNTAEWELASTGNLKLENLFDISGTLKSSLSATEQKLQFFPDEAKVYLPIPMAGEIEIGLEALQISHSENEGFSISCETTLSYPALYNVLPDIIKDVFPKEINIELLATNKGITLKADRLFNPLQIQLPDIDTGSGNSLSIGYLALDAANFEITISDNISLSVDFGLGLPEGINKLFGVTDTGEANLEIFRCYDPNNIKDSLITFTVSVGTEGISGVLSSSPFKVVTLEDDPLDSTKVWCNVDLGTAGAFRLQMPVFSYDFENRAFTASGGFEVTRQLSIPLGLLKGLLEQLNMGQFINGLPDEVALNDLSLLDDENNFNNEVFIDLIKSIGVDADVVSSIEQISEVIADNFDKTPERLRHYLNIKIPDKFFFDIAVSPEGSVKFNINTGDGLPVKLLFPVPAVNIVNLVGIELRGVSFGVLFGALPMAEIDVRIDLFNLLSLGVSLILPDENNFLLPSPQCFQQTLIIDKLTAIFVVIPQAPVPIPIPIFYDELGIEYVGVEGVDFQLHIQFPLPKVNFLELGLVLLNFVDFVTDSDALMTPELMSEESQFRFGIGNNYLQLPKYLGAGLLGYKGDEISLNSYEIIANFMNAIKQVTLDKLLTAVPLEFRVGNTSVDFGPFSVETQWLITNPDEFREGAYQQLGDSGSESFLLELMGYVNASEQDSEQENVTNQALINSEQSSESPDEGLVIFLNGQGSIDQVAEFSSTFAIAVSETGGFKTGFNINGMIAQLLDFEMAGSIQITDPNSDSIFQIDGYCHFNLLNEQIFKGVIALNENSFLLSGQLDLFPNSSLLKVTGEVTGILNKEVINSTNLENALDEYINADQADIDSAMNIPFYLGGAVEVSVFDLQLINANVVITDTVFYLQGTMLGVAAKLDVKANDTETYLNGELALNFGGLHTFASIYIDNYGTSITGVIEPLDLGFLAISSIEENSPLTANIIVVNNVIEEINTDCKVTLLGITTTTYIAISQQAVHFKVEGNIFNTFMAAIEVNGRSLTTLVVKATFDNGLSNTLIDEIYKYIESVHANSVNTVEEAIVEAQTTVDEQQVKVNELLVLIEQNRAIVEQEQQSLIDSLTAANNEINVAQSNVSNIQNSINHKNSLIGEYSQTTSGWWGIRIPHPNVYLIPGLVIEVAAETIALATALAVLGALEVAFDLLINNMLTLNVDLDPRVSVNLVLHASATLILNTLQTILIYLIEGVHLIADTTSDALNIISDLTQTLLIINSAEMEGALSSFSINALVKLKLELIFMGDDRVISVDIVLGDIAQNAKVIADLLLGIE